eukprot:TRINITY_DN15821_c0_g1_i1.p1 TRINITY_DN15821_c0_g1~~TRINITY_DN15821_c0_g1_i1.p1  ORF type:complete len:384 (+),score=111.51 TRINITY_DN15821_c0_g1_i1:153-1304(+)
MGCGPVKEPQHKTMHKPEHQPMQGASPIEERTTKPSKPTAEEPTSLKEAPQEIASPSTVAHGSPQSRQAEVPKEVGLVQKEDDAKAVVSGLDKDDVNDLEVPRIHEEVKREEPKIAMKQKAPAEEESKAKQQKQPAPKKPAFDPSAFKYTTQNPGLIANINKILSKYNPNEDASKLSPLGKSYYAKATSLHQTFAELINDPNWVECGKGKDCIAYSMKDDSFICCKVVAEIPLTPIEYFAFTNSEEYMKDVNEMMKEVILIEDYKVNMELLKMVGKGMLVVSARDFVCLGHTVMDSSKGVIEKVSASIEDPRCPVNSDYVRGEIKISAMRFTPNESGGSDVIIVSMSDPKGSIPNMFKKGAPKKQIERMETVLKKYYKKFGNK